MSKEEMLRRLKDFMTSANMQLAAEANTRVVKHLTWYPGRALPFSVALVKKNETSNFNFDTLEEAIDKYYELPS